MEEDFKKLLQNYREELQSLVHKSQDDFEKQLVYLSAGGIAISMAFVEKITGDISLTVCKGFLIAGWVLFALSLLINFVSHVFTTSRHMKTIMEIDEENYDQVRAKRRNSKIRIFNWCSMIALFLGIIAIIYFVIINI